MSSARVPAWKRLGLKLKGAASGESPTSTAPPPNPPTASGSHIDQPPPSHRQSYSHVGAGADVSGAAARSTALPARSALANGSKRKLPSDAALSEDPYRDHISGNKRPRIQGRPSALTDSASPKPEKSVSFAEDAKGPEDGDADAESSAKKNKNKKKKKKQKQKQKPNKEASSTTAVAASEEEPFSLSPALSYLRQWDADRESWKFNKNHQTLLIKYVFDEGRIPPADIATFYRYIRDLRGSVRTRLRQTAREVRKRDMADGQAAFPPSTEDRGEKQEEYEAVLSSLLEGQQQQQDKTATTTAGRVNGNGKRTLDEVEFVLRTISPEVKQRVVKRMRAEAIADELSSDSDESTSSSSSGETSKTGDNGAITATATTTASSSSWSVREAADAQTEKRVKLNDGTQQKVKRRRLRNARTQNAEGDESSSSSSSSSSESESESESGSSSSSSSSSSDEDGDDEEDDEDDDDEDEEMPPAPELDGVETSSSSSSSSSESDSGSDESESDGSGDE